MSAMGPGALLLLARFFPCVAQCLSSKNRKGILSLVFLGGRPEWNPASKCYFPWKVESMSHIWSSLWVISKQRASAPLRPCTISRVIKGCQARALLEWGQSRPGGAKRDFPLATSRSLGGRYQLRLWKHLLTGYWFGARLAAAGTNEASPLLRGLQPPGRHADADEKRVARMFAEARRDVLSQPHTKGRWAGLPPRWPEEGIRLDLRRTNSDKLKFELLLHWFKRKKEKSSDYIFRSLLALKYAAAFLGVVPSPHPAPWFYVLRGLWWGIYWLWFPELDSNRVCGEGRGA